jgi:hypothetical protein
MTPSHSPHCVPSCRGCWTRRSRAGPVTPQAVGAFRRLSIATSQRTGPRSRSPGTMINSELRSHTLVAHLILRSGSPVTGRPPSTVALYERRTTDSDVTLRSTPHIIRGEFAQPHAGKPPNCPSPFVRHADGGDHGVGGNSTSSHRRVVARGSPSFSGQPHDGVSAPLLLFNTVSML